MEVEQGKGQRPMQGCHEHCALNLHILRCSQTCARTNQPMRSRLGHFPPSSHFLLVTPEASIPYRLHLQGKPGSRNFQEGFLEVEK